MLEFVITCGFLFLAGVLLSLTYIFLESRLLLLFALLLTFCGGIPLFNIWLKTALPYFIDDKEDSHEDP